MPKFKTTLLQAEGMNATGIEAPPEVVESLNAGKRAPVKVTINGHSWRSTVALMGGKFMVGVPKEHREAAGIKGGDRIEVTLDLDDAPRVVEIPKDLAAALKKAGATKGFEALSYTFRKEHVRSINEAKADDTRARRVEKAVVQALTKVK